MVIQNGNLANADEVLDVLKVQEIYTGSDFDASGAGTNSHELSVISSSALVNSNYIEISIFAQGVIEDKGTDQSTLNLRIEAKEVGGSYSDSMPSQRFLGVKEQTNTFFIRVDSGHTVTWFHTLTAGEKTNGVQFRISSIAVDNDANILTLNNKQTIVKVNA